MPITTRYAICFALAVLCLTGCKTAQSVTAVPTGGIVYQTETRIDTIIVRDSVYVEHWQQGDTIRLTEYRYKTIYKTKIERDTLRDTIRVPVEVCRTERVNELTAAQKLLCSVGRITILALLILFIYMVIRLRLKR